MSDNNNSGAIAAILEIYTNAVQELQQLIHNCTPEQLTAISNPHSTNPECISVQAVLTHVVSAGYSYCVYIRQLKDPAIQRPPKVLFETAAAYETALNDVLQYTKITFETLTDTDLEDQSPNALMHTTWGQVYDREQIMEHAIVHIWRHIRQIRQMLLQLQKQAG